MTLSDILLKLKSVLPINWFGDNSVNSDSVLMAPAHGVFSAYSLLQDIKAQTRLKTTTGGFLDFAAGDFYGDSFPRILGETDAYYYARIVASLFKEKATILGLTNAVNLTMTAVGVTVNIYEYGMGNGSVLLEDNTNTILAEDGTNSIDMEAVVNQIPAGSIPIGLSLDEAAARFGTNIGAFESLIIITGMNTNPFEIDTEDGDTIQTEDNTTMIGENIEFSLFQYLWNIIMDVKPIGTVVWVSIT